MGLPPHALHRVGAALLMGAAVCTMHYTGMSAASVVCTTADRSAWMAGVVRPTDLGFYVSFVALGIACVIAMDVLMQRLQTSQAVARAGT